MGEGEGEIMLFGVRVVVDSLRKTVSLNNLSHYHHLHTSPPNTNNNNNNFNGYVSTDEAVAHHSSGSRSERKREKTTTGVAWTEEEHKLFLMGLKRVGKGDWRTISRNFVKTRTPTQVASHAQKYFLRRANLNRRLRRRRSSLFDITTDEVSEIPLEEEQQQVPDKEKKNISGSNSHVLTPSPQPETTKVANFCVLPALPANNKKSVPADERKEAGNHPSANPLCPFQVIPAPCASPVCDLNLDLNLSPTVDPLPLSLKLSLASNLREISSGHSAFQVMQGNKNGDSIISVA